MRSCCCPAAIDRRRSSVSAKRPSVTSQRRALAERHSPIAPPTRRHYRDCADSRMVLRKKPMAARGLIERSTLAIGSRIVPVMRNFISREEM